MFTMIRGILMALIIVFGHPFTPQAALITDVNQSDLNVIVSQNSYAGGSDVSEEYKETALTSYEPVGIAPLNYAVVNSQGGFFDKIISFDPVAEEMVPSGFNVWYSLTFNINILNSSPYIWEAFRFELWDDSFTQQLNYLTGRITYGEQEIFRGHTTFDFYPELTFLNNFNPEYQDPGESNNFYLEIAIDEDIFSFGLRQIAITTNTTDTIPIPLPSSVWLIGSGLL